MKRSLPFVVVAVGVGICAVIVGAQALLQMGGRSNLGPGWTLPTYTYGHYNRNESLAPGTSLWDGYGNYGSMNAAVAVGGGNGVEVGSMGVAAYGSINIGVGARANAYKAGATHIGMASWTSNLSAGVPSGKAVGLYVALEDAPHSGQLDPDLVSAGGIIDTYTYDVPSLILRQHEADVLSVPAGGQLKLHTAGRTKPTCDASRRGELWFAESVSGAADGFEACGKDQADAYVWKPVAIF